MLKLVQLALFLPNPPKAEEVARACFPNLEVSASMSQATDSTVNFAGQLEQRISCSTAIGRIDFLWEPKFDPPNFEGGLISIEDLEPSFQKIEEFANSIAVSRVAFILTKRTFAENSLSAVELGRQALKGVEIRDNATEITYRTNVPKLVAEYQANRILHYQVAMIGYIGITASGPQQHTKHVWEHLTDVNTVQEHPIPSGKAGGALRAMKAEAIALSERGLEAL